MDTCQHDELFQFYVDLIHYLFKAQDYVHMLWKKNIANANLQIFIERFSTLSTKERLSQYYWTKKGSDNLVWAYGYSGEKSFYNSKILNDYVEVFHLLFQKKTASVWEIEISGQILNEIWYLRATIAPNIRERFKLPSGKFQKLSLAEMKNQIKKCFYCWWIRVHQRHW